MKGSALQQAIREKVLARHPDAYVRKLADRYTRGLPDLVIIYVSPAQCLVVLMVEVKGTGDRMSALQEEEQRQIEALGARTFCGRLKWITATSVDDVLKAMAEL